MGLKEGLHELRFEIGSSFFKHFEGSLISNCEVEVRLELEKRSTFFVLTFFIDGWVEVECDRCLEKFQKDIFGDFTSFVKYEDSGSNQDDDSDVMYISKNDDFIDVSQLIYENIILCLPMQIIHPKTEDGEDGCDPRVLSLLKQQASGDSDFHDGLWDKLKDFRPDN